jgi:hypothetical protein
LRAGGAHLDVLERVHRLANAVLEDLELLLPQVRDRRGPHHRVHVHADVVGFRPEGWRTLLLGGGRLGSGGLRKQDRAGYDSRRHAGDQTPESRTTGAHGHHGWKARHVRS